MTQLKQSERYSFSAVEPTSLKWMQIVSTLTTLPTAPTVALFSVVPAKFPYLWLAERILLAGDAKSNPGPTLVGAARPHAGASAHVLNHTTLPTKHTTLSQANNTKHHNTTHNPIKTPV